MSILSKPFETIRIHWSRWKSLLLHTGVFLSVLLVAVAIAYKGTDTQLQMVLILFPALIAVAIMTQLPGLGLILTFVGGVFIKFTGPSGLNITMVGIGFLLVLWLAKMFIVERKIHLVPSRIITPVLVFVIIALICFGIGLLPFLPYANQAPLEAQLGGLATFILCAGAFLTTAHIIDLRWLERFTWVFVAVGASYIISWSLFSLGMHNLQLFDGGVTNNSMFFTWLVALAFSQAWFNKKLPLALRGSLGVLILVTFYLSYVFAGDWKSGWVPPLVAILAMLGVRYWKLSLMLVPVGMVIAVIAAIQIIGTDTYSWGTRVDAWIIVIEMAKISPIFGLGFSNYYWYSRYFPIRGWYVPFNSHNQYVDLIAQTGLIGTICFLWIFWEVGRLCWSLRERVPIGFPRAYVYGVVGGIIGTLVAAALADWVLPFTYNIGFKGLRASVLPWIFMGGMVSLEQLVKQQSNIETA